ncbi:MAG: response regulator transcription factor [Clostridia bacterium]
MIGKPTILIVEDDKYISGFMEMSLKQEGYPVLRAATAAECLFLFSGNHPDIVLLDLGLPDQDGLGVIREVRAFSHTPIVVVSARGQESEKIEALDAGADDYVTKPFHMGELLARVRVIERKLAQAGAQADAGSVFEQGDLRVDYEKRKVTTDAVEAHLTPMEYKLLTLLIANKGKVLTHNFIAREVWGYADMADTRTLRVVMANLRRKLEKDTAQPRHILTEIGVGYRFSDE